MSEESERKTSGIEILLTVAKKVLFLKVLHLSGSLSEFTYIQGYFHTCMKHTRGNNLFPQVLENKRKRSGGVGGVEVKWNRSISLIQLAQQTESTYSLQLQLLSIRVMNSLHPLVSFPSLLFS